MTFFKKNSKAATTTMVTTPKIKTSITNTSPSTDIESLPATPTTIRIEHKVSGGGGGGGATGRFLGGVSRPVILVVGLFLFLSMGGVGFLLDQFLRAPGLKKEIEKLEQHVINLKTQVGRLEGAIDELGVENDRYENLNTQLNGTVQDLSTINGQLNRSNTQFAMLNDRLDESNAQLASINLELINRTLEFREENENLVTVVAFLNETTLALDGTLSNITKTLALQIEASRQLTLGNYEVLYLQSRSNWDCDYNDYFLGDTFTTDRNAPMGETSYPAVRDYVEFRLLDQLCLNSTNWEDYMVAMEIPSGNLFDMTTVNLIRGIQRYTGLALNFFYPSSRDLNTTSISWDEWADAGFNCANLKRTYQWEL